MLRFPIALVLLCGLPASADAGPRGASRPAQSPASLQHLIGSAPGAGSPRNLQHEIGRVPLIPVQFDVASRSEVANAPAGVVDLSAWEADPTPPAMRVVEFKNEVGVQPARSRAPVDSVAWLTRPLDRDLTSTEGIVFTALEDAPGDLSSPGEWLPREILYPSYLAGEKESRTGAAWLSSKDRGVVWESAVGGRAGVYRQGFVGEQDTQAFQLDVEGAALARIDHEEESDVEAVDFRVGLTGTWRDGPLAAKTGYYHLSSHVGDEFLLKNPGFIRTNYVRDSALGGLMYDLTDELRIYGEVAYAFNHEDGAEPWEFQYGLEFSDARAGWPGGPYAAINGHTRQDFGYITSVNVVAGWQWRGGPYSHRLRVGMQYYDGPALQWSFAGTDESFLGGGMWLDF
jgi:hypothetical protein